MAVPERAYDRLQNLWRRLGLTQEDMYYAIENDQLRVSVWMPTPRNAKSAKKHQIQITDYRVQIQRQIYRKTELQIKKAERAQRESARGRRETRPQKKTKTQTLQSRCCKSGMQRYRVSSPKGRRQNSHPNAKRRCWSGGSRTSSRICGHGAISATSSAGQISALASWKAKAGRLTSAGQSHPAITLPKSWRADSPAASIQRRRLLAMNQNCKPAGIMCWPVLQASMARHPARVGFPAQSSPARRFRAMAQPF